MCFNLSTNRYTSKLENDETYATLNSGFWQTKNKIGKKRKKRKKKKVDRLGWQREKEETNPEDISRDGSLINHLDRSKTSHMYELENNPEIKMWKSRNKGTVSHWNKKK